MNLKILVDMNLSPDWVGTLRGAGFEAIHWSSAGDPRATDHTLAAWAREHGYIVFTHDLDFSALLAATQWDGPSIVQVRADDVLPEHLGEVVITALRIHAGQLASGALVTIDEQSRRVRILPLKQERAH